MDTPLCPRNLLIFKFLDFDVFSQIKNNECSWYALKDYYLTDRAKGSVLLEFFFVYNHVSHKCARLNPSKLLRLNVLCCPILV